MDKRLQPRSKQKEYANKHSYFWLPCPICKEPFGGHEWKGGTGVKYTKDRSSGVCVNCIEEAERIDKANVDYIESLEPCDSSDQAKRDAAIEKAVRNGQSIIKGEQ